MVFVWLAGGVLAYHLALVAVLVPVVRAWRAENRERRAYVGCWACRYSNPYAPFGWAPRAMGVTMAAFFTAGVVVTFSAPPPYTLAGVGAWASALVSIPRLGALKDLIRDGRGVPYCYHDASCPRAWSDYQRPPRGEPDNMGGVGFGM